MMEVRENRTARPRITHFYRTRTVEGQDGVQVVKGLTLHNHKTMRPRNQQSEGAGLVWFCSHANLLVFFGTSSTIFKYGLLSSRRAAFYLKFCTRLKPPPAFADNFPKSLCHGWRGSTDQGRLWLSSASLQVLRGSAPPDKEHPHRGERLSNGRVT